MVRPEVAERMIVDLIENLATPLDAIVAILLAVLNPFGPIGHAIACPIGATRNTIGAVSGYVGAVSNPPRGRELPARRKLTGCGTALATSVLQELGGSATGNSGADCPA
jgi:hypothetical protein